MLFNVARVTVAPASSVASNRPSGVNFPVLPTCQITSSKMVVTSSASNLKAIAQRGNLSVKSLRSPFPHLMSLTDSVSQSGPSLTADTLFRLTLPSAVQREFILS